MQLQGWNKPRRFIVVRERVRESKSAVGRKLLDVLGYTFRIVVTNRALAIALGNHDFWVDSMGHAQYSTLDQVVTRFWPEPARDVDAILLDSENLDLGGLAIVGGYGHFDLGLAEPNLRVRGRQITEDTYLSGGMNGLFWNDFRSIPNCGTSVQSESQAQAAGMAVRMDSAIAAGKRVLREHLCCGIPSLTQVSYGVD